jgi:hypothetical protein
MFVVAVAAAAVVVVAAHAATAVVVFATHAATAVVVFAAVAVVVARTKCCVLFKSHHVEVTTFGGRCRCVCVWTPPPTPLICSLVDLS